MQNLLYILHNDDLKVLLEAMENQEVRALGDVEVLNNRANLIPAFVVLMGSMMGFFIVIAYVYLDKDEGVIRAFAVSPSAVWNTFEQHSYYDNRYILIINNYDTVWVRSLIIYCSICYCGFNIRIRSTGIIDCQLL